MDYRIGYSHSMLLEFCWKDREACTQKTLEYCNPSWISKHRNDTQSLSISFLFEEWIFQRTSNSKNIFKPRRELLTIQDNSRVRTNCTKIRRLIKNCIFVGRNHLCPWFGWYSNVHMKTKQEAQFYLLMLKEYRTHSHENPHIILTGS